MMPLVLRAQTGSYNQKALNFTDHNNTGIKWVEGLSWEQILQKAKTENKYIFIDCFATWCGPCKAMDKNVYPDEKAGAAINDKFIAVKVQMDQTDKDDQRVKAWYKDAKALDDKYKIDAFPTLLFFSFDGSLLHRVTQGLNLEGFLDVVSAALDPQKRYYSMLAEYESGKKDTGRMRDLVKAAQAAHDNKMAEKIAGEYILSLKPTSLYNKEIRDFVFQYNQGVKANELAIEYINHLKEKEIFTKENIEFIRRFTKSTKQRGFKLFYDYPEKINHVIEGTRLPTGATRNTAQGDYAQSAVRSLIFKEEFYDPFYKPAVKDSFKTPEPDWLKLTSSITKKYPKVNIDIIIIDSKVTWYEFQNNWPQYSKSLICQMDLKYRNKSLFDMTYYINKDCWRLFNVTDDTTILNKAIYWMEEAFKQNQRDLKWSAAIDTYANLLYKVGRVKEAIDWEAKAIEYDSQEAIKENFDKMKKGVPTWPQH
jgi:thioredoxin-related protein